MTGPFEHPSSRETYDYIADWAHPTFPFGLKDQWGRYGFIGVFADFVLSCTQGEVVEIGVGESSIYLTHAAQKANRRIYHCDISPGKVLNPMSIPGYLGGDRTYFEERDPVPAVLDRCVLYAGSSDSLFDRLPVGDLAFAYIDGDHNYLQAKKDFDHCFERLVENGYILLHDTYPPDAGWIDENHCGDVYRLRQELEKRSDIDVLTLTRGTAVGVGLTIVRKREKDYPYK